MIIYQAFLSFKIVLIIQLCTQCHDAGDATGRSLKMHSDGPYEEVYSAPARSAWYVLSFLKLLPILLLLVVITFLIETEYTEESTEITSRPSKPSGRRVTREQRYYSLPPWENISNTMKSTGSAMHWSREYNIIKAECNRYVCISYFLTRGSDTWRSSRHSSS